MVFIEKTAHFRRLKKTGYTGTIRPSDGRTDGRTDTTSYRDARTHLRMGEKKSVTEKETEGRKEREEDESKVRPEDSGRKIERSED